MLYRLMRAIWRFALPIYFRAIEAEHSERVPRRGPVLLVANHVNAFVDALVLVVVVDRPITLTAKSTLRRNPMLRFLMDSFGVVPLHRRQDVDKGADPARNAEQLAEIVGRLRGGAAVCLFPEGVSHSAPHMQPFRTGAARIALDTAASRHDTPLTLVPVGIHYEAKERLRSSIWLRFGDPIDLGAWLDEAHDAPVEELTSLLETRVGELTLNYERRREQHLVDWAAEVILSAGVDPPALGDEWGDWPAKVRLMDEIQAGLERLGGLEDAEVGGLVGRLREYRRRLRTLGIRAREVSLSMNPLRAIFFVVRELELLLFGLPLLLVAAIQHALPYLAVRLYTKTFSSDADHWASNALFAGLLIWPVLVAAEGVVVAVAGTWWLAILFLLAAPYTLRYAALYLERSGAIVRRAGTFLRFLISRRLQRELELEALAITDEIERLAARAERERPE